MQKLGNIERLRLVKHGECVEFPVARRVRLEVLTPAGTDWGISYGEEEPVFLTSTTGRDVIEFSAQKGVKLHPANDVRVYTSEQEKIHIPATGNPSFANVANRGVRNPELEKVAALAALNATRRMDQMFNEERRRSDERIRQLEEQVGGKIDPQTGEVTDSGTSGDGGTETVSKKQEGSTSADSGVDDKKAATQQSSDKGGEGG